LREKTIHNLRFFDDDDRPDGVCVKVDDPRRTSDEKVDEL
jgi:hypothetical protein